MDERSFEAWLVEARPELSDELREELGLMLAHEHQRLVETLGLDARPAVAAGRDPTARPDVPG